MSPSLDDLRKSAHNLHAEERKLAQAEYDLYQAKIDLVRARDDLDRAVSVASLSAYRDNKIDGKNEAQRKLQLDEILAGDEDVAGVRKVVLALEDAIGGLELQLGYQRAQVRYRRNLFDAALAAAREAAAALDGLGL